MDKDFMRISEDIKPPIQILDSAKYGGDIKEYLKDTGVAIEQLKAPTRLEIVRRSIRDFILNIYGGFKWLTKKLKR